MTRFSLALACCLALAAVAVAVPVPKGINAKKLNLALPRPLMIRMATVEGSEVKLTHDEDDRDPRTAPFRDVIATDAAGRPLTEAKLKERLKKPTTVVVVPCALPKRPATASGEEDGEPSEVDTGDEWRKTLSPDATVIDGAAFNLNWDYGRYDLQIVPAEVKEGEVTVTTLGVPFRWRTDRWVVEENLIWREKDQKAADQFAAGVKTHGVVVYHGVKELPKEHLGLFRDDLAFAHNDGVKRFKHQRIHGGIM